MGRARAPATPTQTGTAISATQLVIGKTWATARTAAMMLTAVAADELGLVRLAARHSADSSD